MDLLNNMDAGKLISDKLKMNLAHLAWVTMFCSIFIWGFGEVSQGSLGNTGNWYRMILVPFSGVVAVLVLMKNASRISQAFPVPLFLFLVFGLVAVASSVQIPTYAFYSMWKGLEVVIDVLLIGAILTYPKPLDSARLAYRIILIIFGILLVVFWVEAFFMPSRAYMHSRGLIPFTMQGVLPMYNGNSLAFLSAVLAFSTLCYTFRIKSTGKKIMTLGLFAWMFLTLILAQSRTSLMGFFAALLVYLFFDRRFKLLALVAVISLLTFVFTGFSDVAEQYVVRGQSTQLMTSLSGRTQGWEAAWQSFLESPITGHGYAAAARVEILGTGSGAASTLHGAVFDVLVGVGLLGLIPWTLGIVLTATLLFKLGFKRHAWLRTSPGRGIHAEMMGMMALLLVRATTSSGLAIHEHTFMLFLVILAYTYALRRAIRPTSSDTAAA